MTKHNRDGVSNKQRELLRKAAAKARSGEVARLATVRGESPPPTFKKAEWLERKEEAKRKAEDEAKALAEAQVEVNVKDVETDPKKKDVSSGNGLVDEDKIDEEIEKAGASTAANSTLTASTSATTPKVVVVVTKQTEKKKNPAKEDVNKQEKKAQRTANNAPSDIVRDIETDPKKKDVSSGNRIIDEDQIDEAIEKNNNSSGVPIPPPNRRSDRIGKQTDTGESTSTRAPETDVVGTKEVKEMEQDPTKSLVNEDKKKTNTAVEEKKKKVMQEDVMGLDDDEDREYCQKMAAKKVGPWLAHYCTSQFGPEEDEETEKAAAKSKYAGRSWQPMHLSYAQSPPLSARHQSAGPSPRAAAVSKQAPKNAPNVKKGRAPAAKNVWSQRFLFQLPPRAGNYDQFHAQTEPRIARELAEEAAAKKALVTTTSPRTSSAPSTTSSSSPPPSRKRRSKQEEDEEKEWDEKDERPKNKKQKKRLMEM